MKIRQKIVELINSLYDLKIFLTYSFKDDQLKDKYHYEAYLTKQYHTIEKGIALPKPRLGFGEEKIKDLILKTTLYITNFGEDNLTRNIASVLNEYLIYHKINNFESDFLVNIQGFISNLEIEKKSGGVKEFELSNITPDIFETFMKSRTSVRNFKNIEVENSIIIKAVEIAKYVPSVCNRQGWKVHIYKGEQKDKLLMLQNGNVGFRESIKNIAIITGDIRYFSSNERNQIGIDSGIFSLSFIQSLYSLGIASCALNTCVSVKTERKMKRLGSIPNNEKLIMYLALGYPKDNCMVAKSQRRASESFVTLH